MPQDIIQPRTKERFDSLKKVLARLEEVTYLKPDDNLIEIINDSIVQRFEFTLELSWNLLKDILTDLGYLEINGPKPSIEKAFQVGILTDEGQYILFKEMLKSRNLMSHTYDQEKSIDIVKSIKQSYCPYLKMLIQKIELDYIMK